MGEYKMTQAELIEFFASTFEGMLKLLRDKNHDYTSGNAALSNFEVSEEFGVPPLTGLLLRMNDKWGRVKTFSKTGTLLVKGEGVKDAFKDLIGYSVLALALLEQEEKNK